MNNPNDRIGGFEQWIPPKETTNFCVLCESNAKENEALRERVELLESALREAVPMLKYGWISDRGAPNLAKWLSEQEAKL